MILLTMEGLRCVERADGHKRRERNCAVTPTTATTLAKCVSVAIKTSMVVSRCDRIFRMQLDECGLARMCFTCVSIPRHQNMYMISPRRHRPLPHAQSVHEMVPFMIQILTAPPLYQT